jgi:hypothetical protein
MFMSVHVFMGMRIEIMRALKTRLRITTAVSSAALWLSLATGAVAAPAHPGGGHPAASGGAPHMSAAPHFSGAPHFAPHIRAGRPAGVPHFAGPRHFATPGSSPAFRGRINPRMGTSHVRTTHVSPSIVHAPSGTATIQHAIAGHLVGTTDPRIFRAHRSIASAGALRRFYGVGWHPHHHLGWIGPLFWPYAYGDFFYYALWPYDYAYYDPFWYYGYDDIYEGIFSPYDYGEYVQGPHASARMATLTQSVAQSCADEAAEVTGWPINQIQAAVQPNAEQSTLLDSLGNAVVKASDVVKTHCPTRVSFTPSQRLADMEERLEGMVQAVNLVQSPLAKFYDALSDEQKARFNELGTSSSTPRHGQQAAEYPELPATPPGRLEVEGRRLQAMLQAVQMIRPPLDDFYGSLSDDQKARFNTIGRQLFAENNE